MSWPDKPSYPVNPTVDGFHDIDDEIAFWSADQQNWLFEGPYSPEEMAGSTYKGPIDGDFSQV